MYTICFDEPAKVLTVRLQSFWTLPTLARFLAEASARGIALRLRHGSFGVFVDCREYPVQSSSLVGGFAPLIERAIKRGVPVVLLLATMLNKLQAERALGHTGIGIFCDAEEARAWLGARQSEAAAAQAA